MSVCVFAGTLCRLMIVGARCVQLSSPSLELRNAVWGWGGGGAAAGEVAGQGVSRHERSCRTALSDSRLPTL